MFGIGDCIYGDRHRYVTLPLSIFKILMADNAALRSSLVTIGSFFVLLTCIGVYLGS